MSVGAAQSADHDEVVVLVDSDDREIGTRAKRACHLGDGELHRAFSVFLFDTRGRVLIQKRSASKMLWPGFWSNSCCSHPRPGEAADTAARRRVLEELGVDCELRFLYKFQYQARFGRIGSEHELCWVFAGIVRDAVRADPAEIAELRFVEPAALTAEIAASPAQFSPWMQLEWQRISADHLAGVLADCR